MATEREDADFVRRFPALRRVGRGLGRRRVPFVQQLNATDCGAAALAMVLGFFGRAVALDPLRTALGSGRDGTSAQALLHVASLHGLRGRAVRLELRDLERLPAASILHWSFSHFVVFERVRGDSVEILDPASGRRRVSMEQLRRQFTGVALLFEPTSSFEKKRRPRGHFVSRFRRVIGERRLLGRILVSSVMLELFGLGFPALIKQVSDRVIPRGDANLLLVLLAGVIVISALQTLTGLVRSHLFVHLRTFLSLRMSLDFIEHLVRLPYAFFQLRPAGDLMMRLNSNDTVRELLTAGALSTILDGILTFTYVAVLLYVSRVFTLLILVLMVAQLVLMIVGRRRQAYLLAESLQLKALEHGYEVELLTAIETLKAMGCEDRGVQRWSDLFVDVINNSIRQGRLTAALEAFGNVLNSACLVVPLLGGTFLTLKGNMTLGTMFMLNAVASGFLGSVGKLCATFLQLQVLDAYIDRVNDVLETPQEQHGRVVRPAPRLRGQVELDGVAFRYSPSAATVVRDISLQIEPGQFVAIVGRSGAGKSTLAHLVLGLYPPEAGAIYFDGINLADLELRSVRQQLGIVTQGQALFGGCIRENISLADPNIPLDDVIAAAKLAQIHDDIAAMPLGYETPLADRGASLSGGQRQRLALARALVRRPAILLLDEATSALDAATEHQVQAALARLRCTRIVIAHRLSTIIHADLILVLDRGRIAEAGTHAQLLRRAGIYAALVAAQGGQVAPG